MLDASAGSDRFFADHYVNLRAPHASDAIAAQLRDAGLMLLQLDNRSRIHGPGLDHRP
ncbi:hypothetical protein [Streptomyces cellostaticus]|uniref:hypothetical protein n=1 Tax=Streptomyces cellostaticus TaxID=67285 RepID=UPI000ABF3310|nr:hypothetical protein [Streptomyces cellostaticus]GHI06236.1 hypothetical protein Scel_45570 [Streptomyces cellostaticus]